MKHIRRIIACVLSLLVLLPLFSTVGAEAVETSYAEPVLQDYYTNGQYEVLLMSDESVLAQGADKAFVNKLNGWTEVSKLRCRGNLAAAVLWSGSVVCAGFDAQAAKEISSWDGICDFCIGDSFALGLSLDGTVSYACYAGVDEDLLGLDAVLDWEDLEYIDIQGDSVVAVNAYGKVYTLAGGSYSRRDGFDPGKIADAHLGWAGEWINFCRHADGRISFWGVDEYLYDSKAVNKENLRSVMPGDGGSVGLRNDNSLVWLGYMSESDPRWEYREEINSCRDVESCWYNDSQNNGGVYVVHGDGSVQVIAAEEGNRLKEAAESWGDIAQIHAEDYFGSGLRHDGSIRVFSLFENSLTEALQQKSGSRADWLDEYVDYYRAGDFEVALRSDGRVDAVGADKETLEEIAKWEDVVSIDGFNYMLTGITQDGRVLSVGFPDELSKQMNKWKGVLQIFYWDDFVIALKNNGKMLVALTEDEPFFTFDYNAVKGWKNIVRIVGDVCPMQPVLVAMDKNGKVYNLNGKFSDYANLNETIRDGVNISTNGYISHCVRKDGSLVSWGPESGMLDEAKLRLKDYVYALGTVGLRKDGSLCYLGKDEYLEKGDPFREAIESCRDVKMLYTDGEALFALKNDGTISVLKPPYFYDDAQEQAFRAQIAAWENADTMEAGTGYVFVRDIAARISIFPESELK